VPSAGSSRVAGISRAAAGGSRAVAGRVGAGARWLRRRTRAHGAGESGLAHLLELQAVQSAGDALVAVSLAGTLFFGVPVGEARGKVALYLLLTMAPFALLAPVIGPALDRLRRGRRVAMAATLLGRALLAWAMARALVTANPLALYPAAFGVLVLSKAYAVARGAVIPRVLPPSIGLVRANARLTLAGLLVAAVAAGLGGGVSALFGPAWSLRLAAAVFLGASFLALALPARVDDVEGQDPRGPDAPARVTAAGPMARLGADAGPVVGTALGAAAASRALSGFLTLFLAFLVRTHPLGGLRGGPALGLIIAAAAAGGLLGTGLGARLPSRRPEALVRLAAGGATLACAAGAVLFGLIAVAVVAMVAGLAQSLSKLALDALIQREVPEAVRSSVFARSETTLQLSWVLGGAIGIVLPLNGRLGLGLAALALAAAFVGTLHGVRRRPRVIRAS
jgi:hypothetical protein